MKTLYNWTPADGCPCDICPNRDACDLSEFGPFACIYWATWQDAERAKERGEG